MKRKLIFVAAVSAAFILAMVLPNSLPSEATAEVYPEGMISYWKFEEGSGTTASDSVGTNHGTLLGDDGPVWTSGQVGGALSFDGFDDRVDCGQDLSLTPSTAITRELWIKPATNLDSSTEQVTFCCDHYGIGPFHYEYGEVKMDINAGECGDYIECTFPTTFEADTWYHLAQTVIVDGPVYLYINGEEHLLGTAPCSFDQECSVFYIGHDFPGRSFNGSIDEFALYDRALTAEEIWQHYQNGLLGLGYEQQEPIPHQPMTGQKLVGYGAYGTLLWEDDNVDIHTMFVFTNPDCFNEITIDRVSILAFNGEVLYEEALLGDDGILGPHELNAIELHDYINPQEPIMPVTVEIFWTGADKNGLPLIGWTQTGYRLSDEWGNLIEVTVGENQMVNLEQELKLKD